MKYVNKVKQMGLSVPLWEKWCRWCSLKALRFTQNSISYFYASSHRIITEMDESHLFIQLYKFKFVEFVIYFNPFQIYKSLIFTQKSISYNLLYFLVTTFCQQKYEIISLKKNTNRQVYVIQYQYYIL